MGKMQLIYLICNLKSFFHNSVENHSIKTINVSNNMFAWPIKPRKVFKVENYIALWVIRTTPIEICGEILFLNYIQAIGKVNILYTSWLPVTWTGGNKIKMVMKNIYRFSRQFMKFPGLLKF